MGRTGELSCGLYLKKKKKKGLTFFNGRYRRIAVVILLYSCVVARNRRRRRRRRLQTITIVRVFYLHFYYIFSLVLSRTLLSTRAYYTNGSALILYYTVSLLPARHITIKRTCPPSEDRPFFNSSTPVLPAAEEIRRARFAGTFFTRRPYTVIRPGRGN